ncbi:MAG: hypothetical protein RIS82_727 [Actinomycetota bacterium]|jgi:hypothetical protein
MNIVYAIAALALSGFVAFSFYKAGKFKATASKETLLGAGFGWVANIPFGLVRLIAWVELLGAVGVVLAPLAAYFVPGFAWAQILGVLAAAGLALTMLVAHIMHTVRGENKYTWKMTTSLFLFSALAAVLQALVTLPVF